jgi:hypothetical protein
MPGDPRVELVLEAILESDCTPEEACRDCPELLPRVKARLRQISSGHLCQGHPAVIREVRRILAEEADSPASGRPPAGGAP